MYLRGPFVTPFRETYHEHEELNHSSPPQLKYQVTQLAHLDQRISVRLKMSLFDPRRYCLPVFLLPPLQVSRSYSGNPESGRETRHEFEHIPRTRANANVRPWLLQLNSTKSVYEVCMYPLCKALRLGCKRIY
jgi:hypothetical protein